MDGYDKNKTQTDYPWSSWLKSLSSQDCHVKQMDQSDIARTWHHCAHVVSNVRLTNVAN